MPSCCTAQDTAAPTTITVTPSPAAILHDPHDFGMDSKAFTTPAGAQAHRQAPKNSPREGRVRSPQ